ncbi:2'-5' RNA ligase family protein [Streptomyces sp. NPDC102441]|uniref:2'-5' RNA ligase family protein n=1 Tax=Streptomyces sp. NPDC102441 TaxID=3366176 RepID=UPI0038237252
MTTGLESDPRAFPPTPPADLDDPQVIIENDWKGFAGVSRMTDHWARPGWSGDRRVYYWMLTFADVPALISRARRCQNVLAHLGMDPVPDDGLHVTMTRIGATTQVLPAQIQHLAALAEQRHLVSFPLAVHPLAGSRGAVRFSVSPWTPLVQLHTVLSALGHKAGVPGGSPSASFRPHLGIQYSNRDQRAEPVIESVAQLRPLAPVHLSITAVDLVELRRTERVYRWDVLHRINLRASSE